MIRQKLVAHYFLASRIRPIRSANCFPPFSSFFSTHARRTNNQSECTLGIERGGTSLASQMAFVSKSHVVSEARPLSRSIIHGRSAFACPPSFPIAVAFSGATNLLLTSLYGYSRARAMEILSGLTNAEVGRDESARLRG